MGDVDRKQTANPEEMQDECPGAPARGGCAEPNYVERSEACLDAGDYAGYLENAKKQFFATQSDVDRDRYERACRRFTTHREIQEIIASDHEDYYALLGIDENATIPEIKKAFRVRAFKYHPNKTDVAGANTAMRIIQKAYFEINTEEKKAAYDARLRYPLRRAGLFSGSPFSDLRGSPFSDMRGASFGDPHSTSFVQGDVVFRFGPGGLFADFGSLGRNESLENLYRMLYRHTQPRSRSAADTSVLAYFVYILAIFIIFIAMML